MDNKYNPSEIEGKWYKEWEENKIFSPSGDGEPYCIMIPPPNVTGTLHMGHAFQVTLMDILCRYHRMLGNKTLWQAGTDHAGIATQMVVERKLTAQGISRTDLGREKFIDQVWDWKSQSGDIITKQLRRMGASLDWGSERFTLDEGLSIAVSKVFIDLYEEGLIYKGKRLVNWDPVLQTALSDLEVISSEENGKIWQIKYFLENDAENYLEIATTRPETILGDTAVAVNPLDEKYKKYIGKNVIVPITGKKVPIISDEYVDMEFGTGCLKITPAHDFNDYEIAKKHNLEIINIFDTSARVKCDFKEYNNLDRFEARKKILSELQESNNLTKVSDHKMVIPRGDRSHSIIEPLMTDQWYVKIKPLAEEAIRCVKEKEIKFVPENWEKTYFEWMNNIQDWCISRQLWWGHRIPAWYDEEKNIYVGKDEIDVRKKYDIKSQTILTQDEDVLDTWFSSSLWPFSTLGWPNETERVKTFYPTSVLITGFDIIFFWVARMIMMGKKFVGEVPFKEIYVHGLVKDSSGKKMSKSKGNIIDPIDLIDGIKLEDLINKRASDLMQPEMAEKIKKNTKKEYPHGIDSYGTDALRFTFASLASNGRDINFNLKRVEGYRNFCNKLWNAARYVKMQSQNQSYDIESEKFSDEDFWIRKKLSTLITDTKESYKNYRFDYAAKNLYSFVWQDYCNWYIEISKSKLNKDNISEVEKSIIIYNLRDVLKNILLLLHPIMPFITEEIYHDMYGEGKFLQDNSYPNAEKFSNDLDVSNISWMIDIVSAIRKTRSEIGVQPNKVIEVVIVGENNKDKLFFKNLSSLIMDLAKINKFSFGKEDINQNYYTCISNNLKLLIPSSDLIDIDSEIDRLSREKAKYIKQAGGIEVRLANSEFIKNAPGHVVVADEQKLKDLKMQTLKIDEQLKNYSK
ncbi:MAG: valine--tRNA ligase [Gammaproteobacteria bacterium]|nr:valine--tRNA ligase [Gammaproteobacteria bacterium]MBT6755327.1 valine--tRNA ligase [Gammaproteobacteria bacterium]MBT7523602.1 valine--tRNA ligase [Gammaproteobacteria bacterium]